jgi:molybdate transport system substrate-binding protein
MIRAGAALLVVGLLAPAAAAAELTLSVAISMREAIDEIGGRFTRAHPGLALRYNFGGSGELQKQIEAGAPVDVFVSAAARQMDELEARGLLLAGSRRVFARNVLTVVTPVDLGMELARPADLLGARVQRVAIGDPRTVPVGQYAEECLRTLGLWERLRPRLVYAENVRQALEYVARGEVDAGFVYTTDVAARPGRVREAFRPAEDTYRPITYPAAVVRDSRRRALALAFVESLGGAEAQATLARLGFQPAPRGAP